jgi:hypothetical protein
MNTEYFYEYTRYKNAGIKSKAKEFMGKFINSFENYAEKEQWTLEYLPKLEPDSNGRIRNELFEEIIFPVLLNGYNNKDIPLMIQLVKLSQNFYQNTRVWEKIDYKTSLEIIEECYGLAPDNNEVTDLFLELMIDKINFSIHEWPVGVLFGNNFATQDECRILSETAEFVKGLDRNEKYSEFINYYEDKVKEYTQRK